MSAANQINADAVAALPPPIPPCQILRGRFISLLPLADGGEFFGELYGRSHGDSSRESVWDFMPYGPFGDASAMCDSYRQMGEGGDPQFYIVRHQSDDASAGIVSYLRIAPAAYTIEIGHIWHAPDRQRGRANTEAAFLLMENAFALGYRRVEWKCNALNFRSRRAALRLGFSFEGVFRRHCVFKGKNRDSAWFSILDSDWPSVRKNFLEWLDSPLGEFSLAEKNRPSIEWSLPMHEMWTPKTT